MVPQIAILEEIGRLPGGLTVHLGVPLPNSVEAALAVTPGLRAPREIAVRPSGRYTEVVGARFA